MPSPLVVAFATRKGGVGKTTLAVALGWANASQGKKTLIIDLETQSDSALSVGADREKPGIGAMLLGRSAPEVQTMSENLDIIAGGRELNDPSFASMDPNRLRDAVAVFEGYDLIILDLAANAEVLEHQVMRAATHIFIVFSPDIKAINRGGVFVKELVNAIESGECNPEWALVMNNLDRRVRLDVEAPAALEKLYPGREVFPMPQAAYLRYQTGNGEPIEWGSDYKPEWAVRLLSMLRWVKKGRRK